MSAELIKKKRVGILVKHGGVFFSVGALKKTDGIVRKKNCFKLLMQHLKT